MIERKLISLRRLPDGSFDWWINPYYLKRGSFNIGGNEPSAKEAYKMALKFLFGNPDIDHEKLDKEHKRKMKRKSRTWKCWLLCSLLGWHNNKHPDQPPSYFDGLSWHGRCSRCGKSVMLDSQGNWFTHDNIRGRQK